MFRCSYCGASYNIPVYRTTLCVSCGRELKSCHNCLHYSVNAPNQCLEPVAEPVLNKEKANFCEWFKPAKDVSGKKLKENSDSAKKSFHRLFEDD